MIRTLADLLGELAGVEAAKLVKSDIKHPTLIGGMYEGLTREILTRSLLDGLDLQVVSGLVIDGRGGTSGQIDCMLVQGTGVPVPYTPSVYQWHVKDVVAVFEVKKNLFGADLSDAFVHLRGVLETYSAWIQNASGGETVNLRPTLRAYAQTTGEMAPPSDQWRTMPMDKHLILHTMMADQIAPLRVVFGYEGYTSERGLRTGFLSYLEGNTNTVGFGPPSLPNLIVAKGSSLVKLSGHPFHAKRLPNGRWPIIASASGNPLLFILELLWTRLSYQHEISPLFGDDLQIEGLAPLLDALPVARSDDSTKWGWVYYSHSLTKAQLAGGPAHKAWQPVELDEIQFVVLNRLCHEDVDLDDPELHSFLKKKGIVVDDLAEQLVATALVARHGRKLTLTTICCACVVLPDGRRIAADNNTGRLDRWLEHYQQERGSG